MDWNGWISNPFPREAQLLRKFFIGWDRYSWEYDAETLKILRDRFPYSGPALRVTRYGRGRGPFSFSKTMAGVEEFAPGICPFEGFLPLYRAEIRDGIDVERAARWYQTAPNVPRIAKRHLQHLIDFEEVLSLSQEKLTKVRDFRCR